jgi:hypothetical protein
MSATVDDGMMKEWNNCTKSSTPKPRRPIKEARNFAPRARFLSKYKKGGTEYTSV